MVFRWCRFRDMAFPRNLSGGISVSPPLGVLIFGGGIEKEPAGGKASATWIIES